MTESEKELPQGVLVDDKYLTEVLAHSWRWSGRYVASSIGGKEVRLHEFIASLAGWQRPPGFDIDHIHGDTGDNRLESLRVITHASNIRNQRRAKNVRKTGSKYEGYLRVNYKLIARRFSSEQCAKCWVLMVKSKSIQKEILHANQLKG